MKIDQLTKPELIARYEIDSKWREAWNSLMNNTKLMRAKYPLQTQLEKIELRASIANNRVSKIIELIAAKS